MPPHPRIVYPLMFGRWVEGRRDLFQTVDIWGQYVEHRHSAFLVRLTDSNLHVTWIGKVLLLQPAVQPPKNVVKSTSPGADTIIKKNMHIKEVHR